MRLLLTLLLILAAAAPALAQQREPPSRVGSVRYVSGNIAFHMAGESQWSAAGVNYPVATGGSFWTDPQSRAEIQIGPSTLGMAGGTEIDVTNLNEQLAQIGIPQGRLYLHLRQLNAGQSFEIDLPQGAVWLLQPGAYDIDAGTTNQPARVAVFEGSARFVGPGADVGINAGDAALLSGSNPVAAQIERAAPDAFVAWCRARDYHDKQLAATYYVSPQMTGYADLDHYGGWQNNPQYGQVWYPSQVPADWAPYRDGRWVWVQPWGWTWVDQQPWGFAPFHYGRWAYVDDRWGWVPGEYAPQPVYAPALVAFVGTIGAGIGISGGVGPAVGWFPLAPGETFWPSYTNNVNYIRNVNITNVKNINTIVVQSNGTPPPQVANANFANRRFATVVPQQVFADADPVAPAAIHVAPAALENAPVVLHPPQVKPAPRPAGVAVQAPEHPRPAPVGPGIAPPAHPASAVSGLPGAQPHPPGATAEHVVGPGRPGTSSPVATIPPHPGAASAPERGAHAPTATSAATMPMPGPGAPGHPGPYPAAAPNAAALPPKTRPEGLPPATRQAPPGVFVPVHPPAPANVPGAQPSRPGIAPQRRPATANEAHPAGLPPPEALPHTHPPAQAQTFHPPAPAVVRPAPAPVISRPPAPPVTHAAPSAPAVVHAPPPVVFHPPAPAIVHAPPPVVARPPAPAVIRAAPPVQQPARVAPSPALAHPQPAHAPQQAHGSKTSPTEKGKAGSKPE